MQLHNTEQQNIRQQATHRHSAPRMSARQSRSFFLGASFLAVFMAMTYSAGIRVTSDGVTQQLMTDRIDIRITQYNGPANEVMVNPGYGWNHQ